MYSFSEIKEAYRKIGVRRGGTVLVKTDLRFLGAYQTSSEGPDEILKAHFHALEELIDLSEGTLVVSTSSTYLCNTDSPFSLQDTKSERGVFTEFVRTVPGSERSAHPFVSYSAIGREAAEICGNVSRHGYGPNTPKARLVDRDALVVSVGLPPRLTCSTVHHAEFVAGVPYRYTKEFMHPVRSNDGNIAIEPYYLFVCYREIPLKRNGNVKIYEHFAKRGHAVREAGLGKGRVFSYSISEFFQSTVDLLQSDIYAWLDHPPEIRPYQK